MSRSSRSVAFRISHNPRLAQIHFVYDDGEVMALYGICPNTLRSWIKAGLKPISLPVNNSAKGRTKCLFLGEELNRFNKEKREANKRKSVGAELHCLPCQDHQNLRGLTLHFESVSRTGGRPCWTCPCCGTRAWIGAAGDTLARLERNGVLIARSSSTTS